MHLKQIAEISLPTRWARFRMIGFEGIREQNSERYTETALALILGDIRSASPIVRIHSQCMTGDVFQSLRCDCRDQLHLALDAISDEGAGILLYEHQEGRGIGLMEKLRAYELQEKGFDTVEANLRLGHAVDMRDYRLPVEILHFLNVKSIRLMTNNPEKMRAVTESGIEIAERLSAEVPVSAYAMNYIATKREKLGHLSGRLASSDSASPIL